MYGVDGETLRLRLGADVGIQVDENIAWIVTLGHLRAAQVKLPAVATHSGQTQNTSHTCHVAEYLQCSMIQPKGHLFRHL